MIPTTKLPAWLRNTTTMQYNSLDLTLMLFLSLKVHGTAAAIRQLAKDVRFKVCIEHQPKMKALAKLNSDTAVLQCAVNIVQRVTDALDIHPGKPVLGALARVVEPPKCHYHPMKLVNIDGVWTWRCHQCERTQAVPVKV
jgi:hypothetical protein